MHMGAYGLVTECIGYTRMHRDAYGTQIHLNASQMLIFCTYMCAVTLMCIYIYRERYTYIYIYKYYHTLFKRLIL